MIDCDADHPHVGGENGLVQPCICDASGPSPRGWGELGSVHVQTSNLRTIPTWVGRTDFLGNRAWPTSDHPHVGGEN